MTTHLLSLAVTGFWVNIFLEFIHTCRSKNNYLHYQPSDAIGTQELKLPQMRLPLDQLSSQSQGNTNIFTLYIYE